MVDVLDSTFSKARIREKSWFVKLRPENVYCRGRANSVKGLLAED